MVEKIQNFNTATIQRSAKKLMIPANAFLISSLVLVVIPALILIIGTILFFTKLKYAKTIGIVLAAIGATELIIWVSITRDYTSFVNFVYILTMLIGVSSLAYAYRAPKK